LLTNDVIDNEDRVKNTQNTFDTLLDMNIIPIINENDTVSTSDIELDDNYALALSVAKIAQADFILIKMDTNSKFMILPRNNENVRIVNDENELFCELDMACVELKESKNNAICFPESIGEIILN
jgi:glutamate 5-kinase